MEINFLICKKFWRRGVLKAFPFIFLLVCLVVLCLIRYGNCQWNRWIYIFQAFYYPSRSGWIKPPKKYSGIWRVWYKNGDLQLQQEFDNGKLNGKWLLWYKGGVLQEQRYFKDDLENGITRSWYKSRRLRSQLEFSNGKRNGRWLSWYSNGNLAAESNYLNDSNNGKVATYERNGDITFLSLYSYGKKHGIFIFWSEHPHKIIQISFYVNDREVSLNTYIKASEVDAKLPKVDSFFKENNIDKEKAYKIIKLMEEKSSVPPKTPNQNKPEEKQLNKTE